MSEALGSGWDLGLKPLASPGAEFRFNSSDALPSHHADGGAMEQITLDRPTFDRLVREHMDGALHFAIRLCGDANAAEDLMQDALLRAHRGWQSFRGESKFRTWLFQIIINCFRDRIGRVDRAGELPDAVRDPASGPLAEAQSRELGEIVAAEVCRLAPRQREVLVLSAYEGMEHREIAAALAMTEQNVRVTLHLARERLKERLRKHMER